MKIKEKHMKIMLMKVILIFCGIKMTFISKNRIVQFDAKLSSSYEEHQKNNE